MKGATASRLLRFIAVRVLVAALVAALCMSSTQRLRDPGELYQTVATDQVAHRISRSSSSRRRDKALKARDWAHAIPLYQALVVARGPGEPRGETARDRCGRSPARTRSAPKAWAAYADAIADEKERGDALAESQRLARHARSVRRQARASPRSPPRPSRRSRSAARRSRRSSTATRSSTSTWATRSRPICPASCASSARPTTSSARRERKREFYRRYLVQRPFGANADVVRAELAKDKDALGTLLVLVEPAVHRAVDQPPEDHRQAARQGPRRRARATTRACASTRSTRWRCSSTRPSRPASRRR